MLNSAAILQQKWKLKSMGQLELSATKGTKLHEGYI